MSLVPALTADKEHELLTLRLEHGWTQQQLADKFHLTQSGVSRIIRRLTNGSDGAYARHVNRQIHIHHLAESQQKLSRADRLKVAELRVQGWTRRQVAERFSISIAGVDKICKSLKQAEWSDRRDRSLYCTRGHLMSGENLRIRRSNGSHMCRLCTRLHKRQYRSKR